jgi:hypothetical protein
MKAWFRYNTGFVNIDDNHVYLTNSGNWSEIADLEEKGITTNKKSRRRKKKSSLFMAYLVVFIMGVLILNLTRGRSMVLISGTLALGYFAYRYMQPNLSLAFKIPKSKVLSITIMVDGIQITFTDNDGNEDVAELKGLDEKAMEFFSTLKASLQV